MTVFAAPAQYRIEPASLGEGHGRFVWLQKTRKGMWSIIGCLCHDTPEELIGQHSILSVTSPPMFKPKKGGRPSRDD